MELKLFLNTLLTMHFCTNVIRFIRNSVFFFNLYLEEWIPMTIYHVFLPKESVSGVKNIEKLRDHGAHWP